MFDIDSKYLIDRADSLEKADDSLLQDITSFSTESIQKALASMGQKTTGNDLKAELISFLKKTFNEQEQLNNDDLKWIKGDPRICAFCYYFLKRHTLHSPREEDIENLKRDGYALKSKAERKDLRAILRRDNSLKLFEIHTRTMMPHSHKDRFKIIESAFLYGEIELKG
jgi:hypothetical protein